MSAVVTRIAPSPTGAMHIGNARAALFNYLYARHCGGKFLLRIEDTDRQRSTEAAVQVIFDSLDWLGLKWDGAPVFQFARAELHQEIAHKLIEKGWAYRDYLTIEEAEEAKAAARAAGHALHSPWRDKEPPAGANLPHVVRFKVPLEGETVIEDLVRGTVRFPNKDIEDLVLLRSDGVPTYNLAVTVDDHDMGVTHVIRGEEHLSNAARQTLIYRAMGWDVPMFGHLPLIMGDDGSKLSKRHGAQSVGEFRDMGYLPEAVRNYLARLGWGHGDDEIFSDEQAVEWFDVKDVTKAPARFDFAKLNAVNQHYIRAADDDRLSALVTETMERNEQPLPPEDEPRLRRVIPIVKDGAKTLRDIPGLAGFALKRRPLHLDEKTVARLSLDAKARLQRLRDRLSGASAWEIEPLNETLRAFVADEGIGFGEIGPLLRGVLTGGTHAPDLASTLFALQREEALGRIDDALSRPV